MVIYSNVESNNDPIFAMSTVTKKANEVAKEETGGAMQAKWSNLDIDIIIKVIDHGRTQH